MKFGLFTHVPWPEGSEPQQVFRNTVEEIQYAEEVGFTGAWLAEHHFSRYGMASSCLVFAGHLAARTSQIRIGTAVLVPPLPVESLRHPRQAVRSSWCPARPRPIRMPGPGPGRLPSTEPQPSTWPCGMQVDGRTCSSPEFQSLWLCCSSCRCARESCLSESRSTRNSSTAQFLRPGTLWIVTSQSFSGRRRSFRVTNSRPQTPQVKQRFGMQRGFGSKQQIDVQVGQYRLLLSTQ